MVRKSWKVVSSLFLMVALLMGATSAPVAAAASSSVTTTVSSAALASTQKPSSSVASSTVTHSSASSSATASSTGTTNSTASSSSSALPNARTAVIKSIIAHRENTLAPGITEQMLTYLNQSNEQTKYYSVSLNPKNPKTQLVAGTAATTTNLPVQTVRDQANATIQQGQPVVAAVNADFFKMATGIPTGNVVKNGVELHAATSASEAFFGVEKDGTPIIGNEQTYLQVKSQLQQALGGRNILVANGKVNDTKPMDTDHEPRTAVGIKADGTVFFVVIDGREAPTSNGISMADLANLMIQRGAVTALNLDGGGSATYVSREPGSTQLTVQNHPSDGHERAVANAWLIVSKTAPDNQTASGQVKSDNQASSSEKAAISSSQSSEASDSQTSSSSSKKKSDTLPATGENDLATGILGLILVVASAATYLISGYRRTR